MKTKNFRDQIGQLMMMGLSGYEMTDEETRALKELRPSGIIYFRRNISGPEQLFELGKKISSLLSIPPLLGIDQEGGRVARLGDPFSVFPGNDFLGRAYESTGNVDLTERQAIAMAKELQSVGINFNFTPVADIHTNPANPVIGARSFSSDPRTVSKLVSATVRAYREARVASCAKHFPGHGDASVDSHISMPVIDCPKKLLLQREILPFRAAIAAKVPAIMSAHVLYPALDPKNIATLSRKILTNLLRRSLGFSGVIVSDDMEMGAVAGSMNVGDAAVEAVNAGVDLLLICKRLDLAQSAHESLIRAVETKVISKHRIDDALRRVQHLKRLYANQGFARLRKRNLWQWPLHRRLAQKIAKF